MTLKGLLPMPDFTPVPLIASCDQVIIIRINKISKFLIKNRKKNFIWFSEKVTCEFLVFQFSVNTFLIRKTTLKTSIFYPIKVSRISRVPFKSDIVVFAWEVTCNYAYSFFIGIDDVILIFYNINNWCQYSKIFILYKYNDNLEKKTSYPTLVFIK